MSPTAPDANLARLPPELRRQYGSGGYLAVAFDLRKSEAPFKANYSAKLLEAPPPLSPAAAVEFGEKLTQSIGGKLKAARVLTRPGPPRVWLETNHAAFGFDLWMVTVVVPSETRALLITYTVRAEDWQSYRVAIDRHAATVNVAYEPIKRVPVSEAEIMLAKGAQLGDVPMMRAALGGGADLNEEFMLNTPLGWAAQRNQLGAAAFLLRHGADSNRRYGLPKRAPLHDAALNGNLEMVRYLVEEGADVNLRNKWGRTALFYATSPAPPLQKPANSAEIAAYLKSKGGAL